MCVGGGRGGTRRLRVSKEVSGASTKWQEMPAAQREPPENTGLVLSIVCRRDSC